MEVTDYLRKIDGELEEQRMMLRELLIRVKPQNDQLDVEPISAIELLSSLDQCAKLELLAELDERQHEVHS